MLQNWGTWPDFQILLETLASIAKKHGSEISLTNVATRWVLQQSEVGAVIVGTRLGVSSHSSDNLNVFKFQLDEGDMTAINEVALGNVPDRVKAKAVLKSWVTVVMSIGLCTKNIDGVNSQLTLVRTLMCNRYSPSHIRVLGLYPYGASVLALNIGVII